MLAAEVPFMAPLSVSVQGTVASVVNAVQAAQARYPESMRNSRLSRTRKRTVSVREVPVYGLQHLAAA